MEKKPIFVITHSRSCSTAFERVFMTQRDTLSLHHEPFGDPFYFGPEKISPLSQQWSPEKINRTKKPHCTYDFVLQTILDDIKDPQKRVFIKDIAYHIIPPSHSPDARPPSLAHHFAPNDPPNPSLLPTSILKSFQFVFLIRKPSSAIPSLYRCFIPPLNTMTDVHDIDPTELGYRELRMLFDYLYPSSPPSPSQPKSFALDDDTSSPIIIDADDLLSNPPKIIQHLCTHLHIPYSPSMLSWPSQEDHDFAESKFEKYKGYHEDALNSTGLKPKPIGETGRGRTREEEDREWEERFGHEAQGRIREIVDACQGDYEYLWGTRMKV